MKISVVIPCRNEAPFIEECLHAIYSSNLPENTQISVFVVDGISDDGTRDIIFKLTKIYDSLKIIDNTKQLTPFAFNLGIYAQKCDYVQIIGARHIISDNYIANCLSKLETDKSIWCVGGKIINEYINNTGRVIASVMGTQLGMGIGNFRTLNKSGFTDTVTSPMYPFWVFEKIGYFDEDLIRNQDDDFNFRVTQAGGEIYFDSEIYLKYYVRGDYKNVRKQFYQYGYWKVYVNQKHQAVTTYRQLVPPLFVAYLFLFLISCLFGVLAGLISGFPLLIYLILVTIVSSNLVQKDLDLRFGDVFKTFPLLHISYGLGYLRGLYEFIIMKRKPSESQKKLSR